MTARKKGALSKTTGGLVIFWTWFIISVWPKWLSWFSPVSHIPLITYYCNFYFNFSVSNIKKLSIFTYTVIHTFLIEWLALGLNLGLRNNFSLPSWVLLPGGLLVHWTFTFLTSHQKQFQFIVKSSKSVCWEQSSKFFVLKLLSLVWKTTVNFSSESVLSATIEIARGLWTTSVFKSGRSPHP